MSKLKPASMARLARLLHLDPADVERLRAGATGPLSEKDIKLYYYLWAWGCGRFSGIASNLQDKYYDACGIKAYLSRICRVLAVISDAKESLALAKELAKQPLPLGKRVRARA